MAHIDVEPGKSNAYQTTILVAVVVLILLYLFAKGLTSDYTETHEKGKNTTQKAHH